jgi:hypothetical protein
MRPNKIHSSLVDILLVLTIQKSNSRFNHFREENKNMRRDSKNVGSREEITGRDSRKSARWRVCI